MWPFEIIQDGGLPPTWIDVTGNSAIRSADPENPTLELNMKCIGSPVAEIWPFAYLGAYGTPFLGEGEVVGSRRWHHSKERWWFPDQLDLCQSQCSTVGDRAFAVAGARLLNSLPHDIVANDTMSHFSCGLKTFLFRQSYPSILF